MTIMLIFLVASNRRVVPLNLAQTHHYLSHLYSLYVTSPSQLLQETLNKITKDESSKTFKKVIKKTVKVPRKLKTSIYKNVGSN